jgi:hypothetical protein
VADTSTLIPGGLGTFSGFGSVSLSATDLAFLGSGSGGQSGIFDYHGGSLFSVVNVGDILDGKTITSLSFANGGLFEDPIAFQAVFNDGSSGIFTMDVPEPSTLALSIVAALCGIAGFLRRKRCQHLR